jgi:hypothetical protein
MESNSSTMQAWMSTLYSLTMAQKKPQEQSPMEKNGTLILKRLVYNTLAEQLQMEQSWVITHLKLDSDLIILHTSSH